VSDRLLATTDAGEDVVTYEEVQMLKKRYDPDNLNRVHFKELLSDLATNPSKLFGAGRDMRKRGGRGGEEAKAPTEDQALVKELIVTELMCVALMSSSTHCITIVPNTPLTPHDLALLWWMCCGCVCLSRSLLVVLLLLLLCLSRSGMRSDAMKLCEPSCRSMTVMQMAC